VAKKAKAKKRKSKPKAERRKYGGRPQSGMEAWTIEADAPWKRLGISRRTYYRWKKRGKKV
jgi:hypothetical protein